MTDVAGRHAPDHADKLRVGDVVLDRAAHLVTVSGVVLNLALQEFRLLEFLMQNADHVLEVPVILERVWGRGYGGDPGTVAVHMLRLRKKLERHPGGSRHLRTVRGLGYIFDTVPVPLSS